MQERKVQEHWYGDAEKNLVVALVRSAESGLFETFMYVTPSIRYVVRMPKNGVVTFGRHVLKDAQALTILAEDERFFSTLDRAKQFIETLVSRANVELELNLFEE